MSARSMIAIQHDDGTTEAIYCHDDGYLDDSEEGLEPGHWYNLSARLKKLKRNQKMLLALARGFS